MSYQLLASLAKTCTPAPPAAPQQSRRPSDADLQHRTSPGGIVVVNGSVWGQSGSIVALVLQGGAEDSSEGIVRSPRVAIERFASRRQPEGESFMKLRKTPIASAVALALMHAVHSAHAQETAGRAEDAQKAPARDDAASKSKDTVSAKQKAQPDDVKATPDSQIPFLVAQVTTPPPPPATVPVPGITVLGI